MNYELVRNLLHETMQEMLSNVKSAPSYESQFSVDIQVVSLVNSVESRAKRQGHISQSQNISRQEQHFMVQALWELIIQGVLVPNNARNPDRGWPWVSFTDYGEKVIFQERPTPYDPEKFLGQFDGVGVDDVMMFYLEEALGCFRANRYSASTIMLGVASERLFYLLLDAFIGALTSDMEREGLSKNTIRSPITRCYEELKKRLDTKKSQLPITLREGIDTCMVSIFNLIRHHRNDTGHPTGRRMTRDEAYANLYVFPHYCKQMCELIEHLKANPKSL